MISVFTDIFHIECQVNSVPGTSLYKAIRHFILNEVLIAKVLHRYVSAHWDPFPASERNFHSLEVVSR